MAVNRLQMQQMAQEIRTIRNVIVQNQRVLCGWSIAGNVCGFLATVTAGGSSSVSDALSSLFYLVKYLIYIMRPTSLECEITYREDDIDRIFNEARVILQLQNQVNARVLSDGKYSLRYSVPFSFIWDILQISKPIRTKAALLDVTENISRLSRYATDARTAIEQQKTEIKHLTPMLEKLNTYVDDISKQSVAVVERIPNVEIPTKWTADVTQALLQKKITIQNQDPFVSPEKSKMYHQFLGKIREARKHNKSFRQYAFDTVKSLRQCLQARNEAQKLPTYQLIQNQSKNMELLEKTQKSLEGIVDSEHEFKQLTSKLKTGESQHEIVSHVTKLLNNAKVAFDKLTEFDVDIESKLQNPGVIKTSESVQKFAEKGCRVNELVNDAAYSMEEANKAMDVVENGTKMLYIFGGIQTNRIQSPKENSEAWKEKSESLVSSVAKLSKHAQNIKLSPKEMVFETFKNNKSALVSQTTKIAEETLEIYDQVFRILEQENGHRNSLGQIRVLQRVFQRIWSSCEQANEVKPAAEEMHSKAQKLRSKVGRPDTLSSKFSTGFESVDKVSLGVNFAAFIFDLYKLCTTLRRHPKEVWLSGEIERMEDVEGNDRVPGR